MSDSAEAIADRLLVLRSQAGDEQAFGELVHRYSPRLRYFLRRLLEDAHAAEDVLQDTMFDAYRGLPRLAATAAFAAWLYRIARDRAYRVLRQQRRAPQPIEDVEVASAMEVNGEFTADDAKQVHCALIALGPIHREVLLLRFMEQMTYDEIGRATGCSLGTVRSRIHYANLALRRAIEGTGTNE